MAAALPALPMSALHPGMALVDPVPVPAGQVSEYSSQVSQVSHVSSCWQHELNMSPESV